jgi:hypothetical protein
VFTNWLIHKLGELNLKQLRFLIKLQRFLKQQHMNLKLRHPMKLKLGMKLRQRMTKLELKQHMTKLEQQLVKQWWQLEQQLIQLWQLEQRQQRLEQQPKLEHD